jgi:hypothetical protein
MSPQSKKIEVQNNLEVIESKQTKGPKQDTHNRLCSPMSEGGEP